MQVDSSLQEYAPFTLNIVYSREILNMNYIFGMPIPNNQMKLNPDDLPTLRLPTTSGGGAYIKMY